MQVWQQTRSRTWLPPKLRRCHMNHNDLNQRLLSTTSLKVSEKDNKSKEDLDSKEYSSMQVKASPLSSATDDSSSNGRNKDMAKTVWKLFHFARPEHRLVLQSAATLLVTSSSTLIIPAASGHVLDLILAGDPSGSGLSSPTVVAAGLFGLTAAAGAGVYARTLWLQRAGNQITARLKEQLFGKILQQEMAFLELQKTGDLVTRLSQDTVLIQTAVTKEAVAAMRAIVMSTGSAVMLFSTSSTLAVLSLATLPPLFLGARYVGRQLREKQKQVQTLHGKATTSAEEALNGIATVTQFGAEPLELNRYRTHVVDAHQAAIETGRTQALFDGSVHVAANGAILCVLGYGGSLVMQGGITAGDLTGFLMYSLLLAGNVSSLSTTYAEVSKAVAAADRIWELLEREPAIPSSLATAESTKVNRSSELTHPMSVEFRNVRFSYPTRKEKMILGPSFSLFVEPGEVLALVGNSGSGKSTIASLLTRLYDIENDCGETESAILVNGKDIRDWDSGVLRKEAIGIVSQEPWLLDGTIEENILYGKPFATRDEVREAARSANVLSFTENFTDGLQTQVGPRGTQLSGGQKQRVAIARLLLKDCPIIILDEATSALDAQSERFVQKAIESAMKGRTVISIAHRLQTIKFADRIAVLRDGEVAETGTYEELVSKKDSAFRALMGRQIGE